MTSSNPAIKAAHRKAGDSVLDTITGPFRRSALSKALYALTVPRSREVADQFAGKLLRELAAAGRIQRHGHQYWIKVMQQRKLRSGRMVPELAATVVLALTTRARPNGFPWIWRQARCGLAPNLAGVAQPTPSATMRSRASPTNYQGKGVETMTVQFIEFKEDYQSCRDMPSEAQRQEEALASLNLWRKENLSRRILSVETLVSDHGSSMTSPGGRKFINETLFGVGGSMIAVAIAIALGCDRLYRNCRLVEVDEPSAQQSTTAT